MMSNDELSGGVFEPCFDDLGQDRRQVIVELKLLTNDEIMEERAKSIGPPLPVHASRSERRCFLNQPLVITAAKVRFEPK